MRLTWGEEELGRHSAWGAREGGRMSKAAGEACILNVQHTPWPMTSGVAGWLAGWLVAAWEWRLSLPDTSDLKRYILFSSPQAISS